MRTAGYVVHRKKLKQYIKNRKFEQLRDCIRADSRLLFLDYYGQCGIPIRICSVVPLKQMREGLVYVGEAPVFACFTEEFVAIDTEMAQFFADEMQHYIRRCIELEGSLVTHHLASQAAASSANVLGIQ